VAFVFDVLLLLLNWYWSSIMAFISEPLDYFVIKSCLVLFPRLYSLELGDGGVIIILPPPGAPPSEALFFLRLYSAMAL